VTKGLREIGEQRLKYPTLSVKETMLKLFAIFLKTENPANTKYMKEKYMNKMQCFLEKCSVPEELAELAEEKSKCARRCFHRSRLTFLFFGFHREEKEEGQVAPIQRRLLQ